MLLGIGGHEMGQGIRTALAAAVARTLAIPTEAVEVLVGDTRIAPQLCTAGSWGTASAVPAAIDAAQSMLQALAQLAPGRSSNQASAQILKSVGRPSLEVEARRKAPGEPDAIYDRLAAGLPSIGGPIFASNSHFEDLSWRLRWRVSECQGCEQVQPRGEDEVNRDGSQMLEEAASGAGPVDSLPPKVVGELGNGVEGEGQQVEDGEDSGQVLLEDGAVNSSTRLSLTQVRYGPRGEVDHIAAPP